MALLLWTGVRRSDLVMLGKQHVRDGWLRFTQQKNRARKHSPDRDPDLARAAKGDRCNSNRQYDLFDDGHRQALTVWGFGNWFRHRCVEAGVSGRAHGLRKAGAATAAENGATTMQLM